jgi:hypothetical protein
MKAFPTGIDCTRPCTSNSSTPTSRNTSLTSAFDRIWSRVTERVPQSCAGQLRLTSNSLPLDAVEVHLEFTAHGERAHFSVTLPAEERFVFEVKPGDALRLRIEVFNSVDRSCRVIAVVGWLRFVCRNGLIVGSALFESVKNTVSN